MLIGISGQKFHGKDTLADLLVLHYHFHKISFADPIKLICKTLFNFNHDQLYGNLKETIDPIWNITPRSAFQFIGTDLFRNHMNELIPGINQDFWIHCLLRNLNPELHYVIPDVRFPNEAQAIKDKGGFIIKIIRPSIISSDTHESETLLHSIPSDFTFINNSTTDFLLSQLHHILK